MGDNAIPVQAKNAIRSSEAGENGQKPWVLSNVASRGQVSISKNKEIQSNF